MPSQPTRERHVAVDQRANMLLAMVDSALTHIHSIMHGLAEVSRSCRKQEAGDGIGRKSQLFLPVWWTLYCGLSGYNRRIEQMDVVVVGDKHSLWSSLYASLGKDDKRDEPRTTVGTILASFDDKVSTGTALSSPAARQR